MNWKKLMGIFTAVLMAGLVYGQSPITTISSIDRIGTPDAVDAGYFACTTQAPNRRLARYYCQ